MLQDEKVVSVPKWWLMLRGIFFYLAILFVFFTIMVGAANITLFRSDSAWVIIFDSLIKYRKVIMYGIFIPIIGNALILATTRDSRYSRTIIALILAIVAAPVLSLLFPNFFG